MDVILALKALIMGLVEGFTEFLPISSTGHLILAGNIINFTGEKIKVFNIAIQAGAMLALVYEYRAKLSKVATSLTHDVQSRRFVRNLFIAFLPAATLGFFFHSHIKRVLFSPISVACAFIVGGLIILWVEKRPQSKSQTPRIQSVDDISAWDALKVGCAQAFALIPGTSRSGATIMGGMIFGLSRHAATEFSFFLAIPTLFLASLYSLYKDRALLSLADIPLFSIGFIAAFISAFLCVRWLLRYISTHDFSTFAWYRIAFGIFILISHYQQWIVWAD